MRVQIIGVNYAPERTGIAPYTAGLARHLSAQHEVTVITSVPHYPDWKVAPSDRVWRREDIDGSLRVIRLNHFIPRSPNIAARALFEATFATRAASVGLKVPTDVIISVVPALLGVHAARLVASSQRVPLGVIVQDVVGTAAAQSGMRCGRLVSRLTTGLESSALRAADSVSTIHPRLAQEIAKYTDKAPEVIYNWTHVQSRARPDNCLRAKLGWREDEIVALHSGNMGAKQNLEVVVDAARLAAALGSRIRFVLAGGGNQRARLERYARDCTHVSFLDSVDDKDYMDLLASANVLLVNERPGMNEMSLPSKLTSYLVAGRPVVAATDEHSSTAEFVQRSRGGVVTTAGDAQQLLETVSRVSSDALLSRRLAEQGRAFAEQHLSVDGAMAAYDGWIADLVGQRAQKDARSYSRARVTA